MTIDASGRGDRGGLGLLVRFDPGEAVAIVGVDAVCLVLDDARSELVVGVREALTGPGGADAALDAMVRMRGFDLPPFGLVSLDGAQARIVVRGQVGVTLRPAADPDGPIEVVGDRVRTWVDRVVDDVATVLLRADASQPPPTEPPAFDVTAGLLPARNVELVLGAASTPGPVSPSDALGADVAVAGGVENGAFDVDRASDGVGMVDDRLAPTVFAPEVPAWMPSEPSSDVSFDSQSDPPSTDSEPVVFGSPTFDLSEFDLPGYEPPRFESHDSDLLPFEADPQLDPPPVLAPLPPEVAAPAVDHSATLVGPFDLDGPDDDAVDPAQGDPEPPFDPLPAGVHGGPDSSDDGDDYDHLFGATQFRTVEQAAVRPAEDDGADSEVPMISGVPGSVSGASGAGVAPGVGDHDGHTVSLSSLRAQLKASAPTPGTTPSVHAVYCPAGHLNPTHAGTCRACGAVVLDQEHVSVPRPVLGAIVFSDGREVPVTRPLLIGRSPKVDGALSGEAPELVVVASPLKEVSGTHVEIRLEGWQVLVVDRQSTNGTVITAPGRDPQRLRPGEPVPITPGTVVNLAEEVRFTFEVDG